MYMKNYKTSKKDPYYTTVNLQLNKVYYSIFLASFYIVDSISRRTHNAVYVLRDLETDVAEEYNEIDILKMNLIEYCNVSNNQSKNKLHA